MNEESEAYHFGPVLWITPKGKLGELLAEAIRILADRLGGPCFAPHITLLGSIPGPLESIAGAVSSLGTSLTPFSIETQGIGIGEDPFRALYLPIPMTAGLWQLRQIARRYLHPEHPEAFLPHISLYYGSAPREDRIRALATVSLARSFRLEVQELDLVLAEGQPADWRGIKSFPLGRNN